MEPLTLGLLTDLHLGPPTRFQNKLRKLGEQAASLTRLAIDALEATASLDALINLGDDIEDESPEADRARYGECQALLRGARAPLINVAGNHDTIHLGVDELRALWGTPQLHYFVELRGWRLVVLHTIERKDVDVRMAPEQLQWLSEVLSGASGPAIVLMHHCASEQELSGSRWFSEHPQLALIANRREVREVIARSRKVRAVFNGHVHRNHLALHDGIPYLTLQSLIENIHEDAPGTPAFSHTLATFDLHQTNVRVLGTHPAHYQLHHP